MNLDDIDVVKVVKISATAFLTCQIINHVLWITLTPLFKQLAYNWYGTITGFHP